MMKVKSAALQGRIPVLRLSVADALSILTQGTLSIGNIGTLAF